MLGCHHRHHARCAMLLTRSPNGRCRHMEHWHHVQIVCNFAQQVCPAACGCTMSLHQQRACSLGLFGALLLAGLPHVLLLRVPLQVAGLDARLVGATAHVGGEMAALCWRPMHKPAHQSVGVYVDLPLSRWSPAQDGLIAQFDKGVAPAAWDRCADRCQRDARIHRMVRSLSDRSTVSSVNTRCSSLGAKSPTLYELLCAARCRRSWSPVVASGNCLVVHSSSCQRHLA